jgi:drug/metabolite transporter (DMT)-like permease
MNSKRGKNTNMAYLFYIISLLIFGTNGILAAHISLEGSQIVLMRTLIGGIFLTFLVIFRGGFNRASIKKEMIPIIFGGIALGMNRAMLFAAYRLLNVSLSTLIYYVGPILVLLFSPILLKETLTKRKVLSVIFVAMGLVCISGSIVLAGMHTKGMLAAFLAALFYAALIVFNKKIKETNGLQTAAMELDIAFIVVIIYVALTVGLPKINREDLPYIAIIGFVNTGLAYMLYFYSIQKISGQTVALLSYVDPVSALIFSSIFLKEAMTPVQIIGSVLIIGGAIIGEIKRKDDIG